MVLGRPADRPTAAVAADLMVTLLWVAMLTEVLMYWFGWPERQASLIAVSPVIPVSLYHLWFDPD